MADLWLPSRDELARLLADAAAEGARRVLAQLATGDRLLTIPQAAEQCAVSVRCVRGWIASGQLAALRLPGARGVVARRRGLVRVRASELGLFIARSERSDEPGDLIDLVAERAARRAAGGVR
ncbi:MAG: helix-turn-helix domain-containing protein [Polyangiaceae bacterium]|nr:helix-turn-helix domain-containing protein [Polyangiaceae bacterium]